ncbi:hypothetical protein QFZ20_002270 [Flavobacterium sp. W4I14]|nr:hypothetical protein [Flavobacterium sp. W4I14]
MSAQKRHTKIGLHLKFKTMKSNHTSRIQKRTLFVFKNVKQGNWKNTSDPTTTLFTTTTNTTSVVSGVTN